MAQVPDRQDIVPPLRIEERVDAAEIIIAIAAIDQRPGNAFAATAMPSGPSIA
jgi:hypothetical protein